MPKTPSNKLFQLIKSLSSSEKRYFKIYATSGNTDKSNKYLTLFDAIEGQEVYDDDALKELVYQGEEIHSRKYSELKAYLYDLILRSLQAYDEKSSISYQLKNLLLQVRVLYKRSHYSFALEQLAKARKLAERYENYQAVLETLEWEKRIAYTQSDISFLDDQLAAMRAKEEWCLKQLDTIATFRNLYYSLVISIRKEALLRSEEKRKKLDILMQEEALNQEPEYISSLTAQLLFHRIKGLYAYSVLDYKGFYQSCQEQMALMEAHSYFRKENTTEYISLLSNLTISCGLLGRFEEVNECLDKFLKIKPVTANDKLKVHLEYYSKKFSYCISTGAFDEGRSMMQQHLKEVKQFDTGLFESGRFYFQYFYLNFGTGDYDEALNYLNLWLNLPRSIERQDLQSLARILNLVIHFEMGNTMLLEYLLRSTYRFLKTRNRVFAFELRVLKFIKESNNYLTRTEIKEAFQNLKADFERLAEDPSERVMMQYFDFISWLESKIQQVPFGEIVRSKYLESIKEV